MSDNAYSVLSIALEEYSRRINNGVLDADARIINSSDIDSLFGTRDIHREIAELKEFGYCQKSILYQIELTSNAIDKL